MDTREAQDIMRRIYFDRDKARGIEETLLTHFRGTERVK